MQIRRAQPGETCELRAWIADQHYLQTAPPGWVHLYEFIEGRARIGGLILGRPCARQYDPDRILQLHRLFFIDATAPNVESQGLAMMRRMVRVWLPQIRGLLSYSDPSVGHEGTIYEADMWCPLGLSDEAWGDGWRSRGARRHPGKSRKLRWFRTP